MRRAVAVPRDNQGENSYCSPGNISQMGDPIGFTCSGWVISHVRWSECPSLIAFSALSRKKALIVEPISRTWLDISSYSLGRSFTVTRTAQMDLGSVSAIPCPIQP